MKFQETLERFEAVDPNDLMAALEVLKDDAEAVRRETQAACDLYFSDAADKRAKIEARASALRVNLNTLQNEIEAFRKPLTAAVASGNTKILDSIRSEMKELEADKAQISAEIEILENTHMPGEDELYKNALSAYERFSKLYEIYSAAKKSLYRFVSDREEEYGRIGKDLSYGETRGDLYHPDVGKLKDHYNAEENEKIRKKHDERLKAEAEAKARKPRDIITARYRDGGYPDIEKKHTLNKTGSIKRTYTPAFKYDEW